MTIWNTPISSKRKKPLKTYLEFLFFKITKKFIIEMKAWNEKFWNWKLIELDYHDLISSPTESFQRFVFVACCWFFCGCCGFSPSSSSSWFRFLQQTRQQPKQARHGQHNINITQQQHRNMSSTKTPITAYIIFHDLFFFTAIDSYWPDSSWSRNCAHEANQNAPNSFYSIWFQNVFQ